LDNGESSNLLILEEVVSNFGPCSLVHRATSQVHCAASMHHTTSQVHRATSMCHAHYKNTLQITAQCVALALCAAL